MNMKKKIIIAGSIIAVVAAGVFVVFSLKTLGRSPSGERLKRIQSSPHYKDNAFQNIHKTTVSREGASMVSALKKLLFDNSTAPPSAGLPFVRTDLMNLKDEKPTIVWFGHSSYLIKYRGKNILVDPVFSGHASPTSLMIKAFTGTDNYHVNDMPPIDVLVITHDHYDHLDYDTMNLLKDKVKSIVTPLGVGEHLEYWGVRPEIIHELDWWESVTTEGVKLSAAPSRHFSGRSFKRAETLWAAFALEIDQYKIFIGGDSGYDDQFKVIGDKWGPFDLAFLECGQYNEDWPYIHMFPEQTVQAALDLKAKVLLPVHWAKFKLSLHAWDDSVKRVYESAKKNNLPLATPEIGEAFSIGEDLPSKTWWISK